MPYALALTPASARRMRVLGVLIGSVWLIFLVPPTRDAFARGDARGVLIGTLFVAFAGLYLASMVGWRNYFAKVAAPPPVSERTLALLVAVALAITAALVVLAGEVGLNTGAYLAVMTVLAWPRAGIVAVLGYAALAEAVLWQFTGSLSDRRGLATSILTTGLLIWAFLLLISRARAQVSAAESEAALGLAQERERFARDLHDILGHSLTVITIKAELAGRLVDAAPERAKTEIADLERLSREALADIRRAVQGYREISLAGELARAREALRAAGIEARLPRAIDLVPEEHRELFAWVVREGVTNVLRHSGATRCTITLDADAVCVEDDGRGLGGAPTESSAPAGAGGPPASGSGLNGIRERAAALGGTVTLAERSSHGVRLCVWVPANLLTTTTSPAKEAVHE